MNSTAKQNILQELYIIYDMIQELYTASIKYLEYTDDNLPHREYSDLLDRVQHLINSDDLETLPPSLQNIINEVENSKNFKKVLELIG